MPAGRTDSPFRSDGLECAAWLYTPEGEGPHPCVVMAHGFSAVREQRLDAYAERFAAAGMAVLVFDYRHFGASQGEPRQLLSIARQLADWRAAVAHARNLPDVDARRVAVWGSSFSGGHVVAVAAGDPAIAAVVSQAPFTDGPSRDRRRGRAAGAEPDRGRASRRPERAAAARSVVPAGRGPARIGRGHDRARGRARLRAARPTRQHVGEPRRRADRPDRGRLPPVREVPQAAPAGVRGRVRPRRHHPRRARPSRRRSARPTPSSCATRSATSRSTSIPSSRPP